MNAIFNASHRSLNGRSISVLLVPETMVPLIVAK